jgi:SAM-dependent methyltransferase
MSLAERYDCFYAEDLKPEDMRDIARRAWPRDRVEAIVAYAGEGASILDVGCGNGHLLFQLRHKFTELHGLEYSGARLRQAQANLAEWSFHGLHGSAEDMHVYPDNTFDCLVSADTIEHIPDVYRAAKECYRVLKPGGRLVMNTPNIAFVKKRLLLLVGRFPSTSQANEGFGSDVLFDGGHLHYFSFRSLGLLLTRAGFVLERRVGYGALGRLHNLYPPLLSGGAQWVARRLG